jgi:hypothetical protein
MSWPAVEFLSRLVGGARIKAVAGPVPALAPAIRKRRASPFVLDSVYAGIPYKVIDTGAVDALIAGRIVRFRNADSFLAAANCEHIDLPLTPLRPAGRAAAGL